jgi:uncharacterized protein (DUF305 family)
MKTNRLLPIFSLSIGLVLSGAALDASAQQAGGTPSASTQAFEQNAANMMKNMSAPPYTGDADADFVAHMIPHHQGAVDQAKVEIKYGKDPKMKALAKNIIKAQEEEIAYMKRWQVKHHKKM